MTRTARLLLAAPLAVLAACQTAEGYRQQTELWIGAPSDALLVEWGPPVERDALSDGRELWVYFDREHHHTDGYTRTVPRTRTIRHVDEDGEVTQITESYNDTIYEPPRDWWTECETRFVIARDGRIQDYRFVGNGCVAEEIY